MGAFRFRALTVVFLLCVSACTTSVEERVVPRAAVTTPTLSPTSTPTPTPAPLPAHFGVRMVNDSFVNSGACRIHRGSSLLCWGKSVITGDGLGNMTGGFIPAEVSGFSSGVSDVSVGTRHACAIRNGDLFCWGENGSGEVGVGDALPVSTPAPVLPTASQSFTMVRAGARDQTCAVTNTGALYCWGNNDSTTSLGVASLDVAVTVPTLVPGMDSGVTSVDVGAGVICAVKAGALYCWGANPSGELGVDTSGAPVTGPSLIAGLEAGVTAVSAGDRSRSGSTASSICAIRSGALWCLGENDLHQLGTGNTTFLGVATAHPDLTGGVSSVVVTAAGGCAIQSGVVKCWGEYTEPSTGVVDLSSITQAPSPVAVAGLPSATWSSVVGNGAGFCARSVDLQEFCWGLNLAGYLFADPATGQVLTPVEAGPFE